MKREQKKIDFLSMLIPLNELLFSDFPIEHIVLVTNSMIHYKIFYNLKEKKVALRTMNQRY